MYFIGIDQSLRNTGWCVLGPYDSIQTGIIQPGKRVGAVRLCYIRDALNEVVSSQAFTLGALEGGSFNSGGQLFHLGGVHALVQLTFWDRKLSFVEVAPAQLKKFATKKSGAKKEWVVEAVNNWYPEVKITDDNIADAVVLARIARGVHAVHGSNRHEAEVVVKLRASKAIQTFPTSV
jgi:crossover junction endodeoxyribonuclease RuvC